MWRYNYTIDGYCKNHNHLVSGAKPVTVNSGSGSTLARKAGTKYSKKLSNSNGIFSINGSSNQSYTNNPTSNRTYLGCKDIDTSVKSSVKTYSGLRGTRLVNSNLNDGIKCDPVNSFHCYKTLNGNLTLNKHRLYEKDQSTHLDIKKSACSVDRSNYLVEISNNDGLGNTCKQVSKQKCNITKDMNKVNGYTMGYDLYINDKVKKGCNYNPKDARFLAC
tara:strand:- start:716 stop:1372 length:657 start_codon:yes stop_codon:yes gene_type:complete